EVGAGAGMHEQALEDDLDVARLAEHPLEAGAAPPRPDDREVTWARVAEPLAVEHERHAGYEVGLGDHELAALLDLEDWEVAQLRRKRLIVRPEPAAPSRRPVPIRINAFSEKPSALTSFPALSGPVCRSEGSAI